MRTKRTKEREKSHADGSEKLYDVLFLRLRAESSKKVVTKNTRGREREAYIRAER